MQSALTRNSLEFSRQIEGNLLNNNQKQAEEDCSHVNEKYILTYAKIYDLIGSGLYDVMERTSKCCGAITRRRAGWDTYTSSTGGSMAR